MFLCLYKFSIFSQPYELLFFIFALPIGRIINVTFLSMHGKYLGIFTAHGLMFDILKSQCRVMGMKEILLPKRELHSKFYDMSLTYY